MRNHAFLIRLTFTLATTNKNIDLCKRRITETLMKTRFKNVVFWRLNEQFMPNTTGDTFSVCLQKSYRMLKDIAQFSK